MAGVCCFPWLRRVQGSSRMKEGAGESWEVEPGSTPADSLSIHLVFAFFLLAFHLQTGLFHKVGKIVAQQPQPCICLSLSSPKADSKARIWEQYSMWVQYSRGTMRESESETGRRGSPRMDVRMSRLQLEYLGLNPTGMPWKECAETQPFRLLTYKASKLKYLPTSSSSESCSVDDSSPVGPAYSPSQRTALYRETQDPNLCMETVFR